MPRRHLPPVSAEDLERFETDVLAGFVLARASAGLTDGTIRGDVGHLERVRTWFGRPLWDMEPIDADAYFGRVLRGSPSGTRLARSQALNTYFLFLELRHKVEIHRMTGRVVECPIDEMNRPRGSKDAQLRIPPTTAEVGRLFTGWGAELATCRKFATTARNYTAAKLMSQVGLRVSETCGLDLDDMTEVALPTEGLEGVTLGVKAEPGMVIAPVTWSAAMGNVLAVGVPGGGLRQRVGAAALEPGRRAGDVGAARRARRADHEASVVRREPAALVIDARTLVVFALPDARRLGYQLRMQMGGAYLDQVRLAVTILEEHATADATGDQRGLSRRQRLHP